MIINTPKTMAMRVTDKNRSVVGAILPHALRDIPEGETYFLVINLAEIDWIGPSDERSPALPQLVLRHKLYRKPMFKSVFRFAKGETTNAFEEVEVRNKPKLKTTRANAGTRISYSRAAAAPRPRAVAYIPDIIA